MKVRICKSGAGRATRIEYERSFKIQTLVCEDQFWRAIGQK